MPQEPDHHVVIDGRRWRATDPTIPDGLRTELVHELMAARRAVGDAKRAGDPAAERAARARVSDAKVALGERGETWWKAPSDTGRRTRAAATLRSLLAHRGAGTVCPSEVARTVGGDGWRAVMPLVRELVNELAAAGEVEVRQGGEAVADPVAARALIRIGRPA